jgi:hypothetical protein
VVATDAVVEVAAPQRHVMRRRGVTPGRDDHQGAAGGGQEGREGGRGRAGSRASE